MKFSESWLREWVNPEISSAELLDKLTMAGLEVDGFSRAAPEFDQVVVGKITNIEPHPDADKLQVATVDVGENDALRIVYGADNIYLGMQAPVALIGAVLPGGFKIKPAKLRGVESYGMLCSEKELGLALEAEGIMDLAGDLENGLSLSQALNLDDNIIEVDLTPNRGDCLSLRGISRELGVISRMDVKHPENSRNEITSSAKLEVEVLEPESCPIYLGRVISNINPQAKTPLWMQEKLRRGGIRSIHPLVDVTNYVMLELGQPMHAFDLAKIEEKIIVRKAQEGEKLTLLDGKELELENDTLLIADGQKVLALAGVMGGEASGISDSTSSIFLECAFFNPLSVAGIARKYGLHTDSSQRFERGVDPKLQKFAIERASELFMDIVGGEAGEIVKFEEKSRIKQIKPITLKLNNVKRLLGVEFTIDEAVDILTRLGMQVEKTDDAQFTLTPPSWRFDIELEADLIEELGRIYGYDKLPVSPIDLPLHLPQDREAEISIEKVKQYFAAKGYFEAVTYSFTDDNILNIMRLNDNSIVISNPISSDLSTMRASLLPGLIKALKYNLNRQHKRVRLFETGLKFIGGDNIKQIDTLAGLVFGDVTDEQWGIKAQAVDFYDVKSDIVNILGDAAVFKSSNHPSLHPGQTAGIYHNKQNIGYLGKIHPEIAKKLEVPENTYLFEIDLEPVLQTNMPAFSPLSKFPLLRRDLSIVLDNKIKANHVVNTIKTKGFKFLQDISIFDIYKGESLGVDNYSMALALSLQDFEKTLTDEDIESTVNEIVESLKLEFNAELRD